jgi:hypothetical protein
VLFGVAALLLVIPVEVPEVQDCGTPLGYLLEAPVDVVVSEDGRFLDGDGEVVTIDADAAREARENPCRERVAALAVPAGILLVLAFVVGVVSFGIELFAVRPRQRRAIVAARDAARGPVDRAADPTPPPRDGA